MDSTPKYQPTTRDVLVLKHLLHTLTPPLTLSIIDRIIDHAEYWPCASYLIGPAFAIGGTDAKADVLVLRTLPLAWPGTEGEVNPRRAFHLAGHHPGDAGAASKARAKEHPCRKIEFYIASHDQGWCSGHQNVEDPFAGSFTWFDVGIESVGRQGVDGVVYAVNAPDAMLWPASFFSSPESPVPEEVVFMARDSSRPFEPTPYTLQRNRRAEAEIQDYGITWHYMDFVGEGSGEAVEAQKSGRGWKSLDGSFVRELEAGECITIWMRARFSGWINFLRQGSVRIYWTV